MAYWKFAPESRMTAKHVAQVLESKECPGICGGHMNRLAERQAIAPWHWKPIGYRCDRCGSISIDTRVSV